MASLHTTVSHRVGALGHHSPQRSQHRDQLASSSGQPHADRPSPLHAAGKHLPAAANFSSTLIQGPPPLTRPHGVPSCVGCLGSPRGRKPRSSCHPNLLLPTCFPDPLFCSRAPFEKEETAGRIPHWVLVYRRSTLKSFSSWEVSSFQTSTRTLYSC